MRSLLCLAIVGTMKFYHIMDVFDNAQTIFMATFFVIAMAQDIKELIK